MEPIAPPPSHQTTLPEIFDRCGLVGPFLLLAVIALVVWSLILLLKTRPVTHYYAFISASLWPLLMGILGVTWLSVGLLKAMGDRGVSNPDYFLYQILGQVLTPLLFGSFLTCFFFPIGIALLVFRGTK